MYLRVFLPMDNEWMLLWTTVQFLTGWWLLIVCSDLSKGFAVHAEMVANQSCFSLSTGKINSMHFANSPKSVNILGSKYNLICFWKKILWTIYIFSEQMLRASGFYLQMTTSITVVTKTNRWKSVWKKTKCMPVHSYKSSLLKMMYDNGLIQSFWIAFPPSSKICFFTSFLWYRFEVCSF